MTHDEKLEIAELLDEMGVDIIEAGFPIASEGDFKAVSEIARRSKNSTICGLARANYKDIDSVGKLSKILVHLGYTRLLERRHYTAPFQILIKTRWLS